MGNVASKIAEKLASKGGAEDALQTLERLLPSGASDAERAALRQNPEVYKQYLDALDAQYGNRAQRSKDLGFSDDTYYHGTAHDFDKFRSDVKTYVSPDAWTASHYAEQSATDHAKWGADGVLPESEYYRVKNGLGQRVMPLKVKNQIATPNEYIVPEATVANPTDIRSTNAAFDPRFKDSADILALTGNQAPKIVSKMLRPRMSLGDAFSAISEPIAELDKPVTDAVDYATQKIAAQTNLVPVQARTPTTQYAEEVRKGLLNQALQFATPTPSSLLMGKAMPLLKAAKGSQIAEKMITGDVLAAGKAAMAARAADDKLSQFATKSAENRLSGLAAKNAENKLSEFASKDLDWTNLEHMPSAAELYRNAKAANKGVVVVPSAADRVADKMNWGTVTVKP